MTYLQFHLVFILPPILLLGLVTVRDLRRGRPLPGVLGGDTRRAWWALLAHLAVALLYTTPWDNLLVARGVWSYGPDRVAFTVGYVPVEEYLFFVLQPLLTGLLLFALARRRQPGGASGSPATGPAVRGSSRSPPGGARTRVVGASIWLAAAAAGVLALGFDQSGYLGLILVWAAPVLAFQWAFGGDLIGERTATLLPAVALPTLYLWAADRFALDRGIWTISESHTTGLALWGLPVEEALFFLLTNLLVAAGLALVLHPRAAQRARRWLGRLRPWWRAALALWALAMIPAPLLPGAFAPIAYASTAMLALGVLGAARQRYGARAWLLFAVAFAFGLGVELLGSRSGFPFGAYRYHAPGPHLLGVPLLVPLGWWAIVMVGFSVGPRSWGPLGVALAVVAWDLGLDPLMTHMGFWSFAAGGAYHGVPASNFLGWAGSAFLLALLLLRLEPRLGSEGIPELRLVFAAQAFLMVVGLLYFGLGLAAVATAAAMGLILAAGSLGPGRMPLGSPK